MINISIDFDKLFTIILIVVASFSVVQSLKFLIDASKRKKIVSDWLKDEKKISLYNLYVRYVETDIITGIRKSREGVEFPVINEEKDYLMLNDKDKLLVQAVVLYITEHYTDFTELGNYIEGYLESAEIVKKAKGF